MYLGCYIYYVVLEFGDAVGMVVCNTFFKKEDSKLITDRTSLETIEV